MDSLTHLFYGGVIAAAIAPKQHRRAALLAGAALNSLPDLDVLPLLLSDDPIVRMTWHRSATHSLLVLPFVAWLLWAGYRRLGGRVAQAPTRWFWVFQITLLAHPLLDALTVYGTQLLWPLPIRPVMWSSLFIIDPLFTLPWLLACLVAWFAHERRLAQPALLAGMVLGIGYAGWSLTAKAMIDHDARQALARQGLQDAAYFSVPMPLTTARWRVVAMTPQGYVHGEQSVFSGQPLQLLAEPFDVRSLAAVQALPSVRQLTWFNHGFMRADVVDGELQLADLRMGSEQSYPFRFAVARRVAGEWRPMAPVNVSRRQTRRALQLFWKRLWQDKSRTAAVRPDGADAEAPAVQATAGNSGGTPATSASK